MHSPLPRSLRALGLAALALLLPLPVAAPAATVSTPAVAGMRVVVPDSLGDATVTGVGDWNADGVPDLAVALPFYPDSTTGAGTAWIVFGRRGGGTVAVSPSLAAADGVTIRGPFEGSLLGFSLASGDVNGDGRDDLVLGTPTFSLTNQRSAAWVVFGGTTGTLDLAGGAGTHGYEIRGPLANAALDGFGRRVAVVPDMNADGRDEVAVGAPDASVSGQPAQSGTVLLTFGRSATSALDTFGIFQSSSNAGFVITGPVAGARIGGAALAGGDVSGDGRGDILVGAPDATASTWAGAAYAVLGKSATAQVALASSPVPGGYVEVRGAAPDGATGRALAVADDMNGDGRDELVVGSPSASYGGALFAGAVHVVFGVAEPAEIDLWALGRGGFQVLPERNGALGDALAPAGDVNGDGRGDVAVGMRGLDANGLVDVGAVLVLLGKPDTATVYEDDLGAHGWRLRGTAASMQLGRSVAYVGSVGRGGLPQVAATATVNGDVVIDVLANDLRPTAGAPTLDAATPSSLVVRVPVAVPGGAPTAVTLRLSVPGRPDVTASLGTTTGSVPVVVGTVTGLAPSTAYTVRASLTSAFGAATGPSATLATTAPPPAKDTTRPTATVDRPACTGLTAARCKALRKRAAAWRTLRGATADPGAPATGVAKVALSIVRPTSGGRCQVYVGARYRVRTCVKARAVRVPAVLLANGRYRLKLKKALPNGMWTIRAFATDKAGNVQAAPGKRVAKITRRLSEGDRHLLITRTKPGGRHRRQGYQKVPVPF